eukprot:TRINITY_DN3661_c0_g1_i2.p1 TRINITY_DN3661_c0_g1~~TRINITY_DN3661_c0_g1_i2.p1  ORF type:complete len:119 (+),score=11.58 TRINITY_DN3661_c0_g1_i2:46-357(+)
MCDFLVPVFVRSAQWMVSLLVMITGLLPGPVSWALNWMLLGFLSCCVMGSGGAFLLFFHKDLLSDDDKGNLAVLFYGLGSVLGEVPKKKRESRNATRIEPHVR